MLTKRLQFTGSLGFKLSALLDLPDNGDPKAFAIFSHCFTCNKNYKLFNSINQAVTENKIGVLRFDFTGLGASQGSFADTSFSSNIEDIIAGTEFLEINYDAPKLLIGHSFGGAAALHAALKIASCKAVVTIATPSSFDSIRYLISSKRRELKQNREATFNISGREIRLKKHFLDDIEKQNMNLAVQQLNKPYLIIHSIADETVSFGDALKIFQTVSSRKSFISLENADHLLSNPDEGSYVGNLIAAWANQFL